MIANEVHPRIALGHLDKPWDHLTTALPLSHIGQAFSTVSVN